jgi:hypothetical protein
MVAFAGTIYWAQNVAGRPGGAISVPKAIWLAYALATFYLLPAFFWRDRRVAPTLRAIFFWFLLSWSVRGAAELYLMFGVHRWIPPYGVVHGLFNLGLLAWLTHRARPELAALASAADRNAVACLGVIRITQIAEIAFALLFYWAVGFDTRTMWFASHERRFLFINLLTLGVELWLVPLLVGTVRRFYA